MVRKLKFTKSQPKWKKERQQIRKEKFKDLILRIATLIVFLSLVLFIYNLWQNLKKSIWDGKHQINLVLQSKDIIVFSFNPEEDVLNMLFIDPDTYIPVSRGYGNYPAGNVVKLGSQENLNGGELLALSFEELLAVPIDGFIIDNNNNYSKENFDHQLFFKLIICKIKNHCDSNLTFWDLYRLSGSISKLKPSQLKSVDVSFSNFIESSRLPDGSEIIKPNFLLIDKLSIEYFSDYSISNENLTVSIYNGTQISGMAGKVGRFVNNIGAELIYSGDEGNVINKSIIYYKDDKILEKYTLKKLVKSLQISRFEKKDLSEDISIIIGNDFIFLQ